MALLRVPAPVAGVIVQELALTPLFDGSLVTAAVTTDVPPAPTWSTDTDKETEIGGTSRITVLDLLGSDTAVATTVTDRSLAGGVAGALYVAEDEVTLLRLPAPDAGIRLHVTPLPAGSPAALPVSVTVPPAGTCTTALEIDTVILGGGGGGAPLLLQPVATSVHSKPRRKNVWANFVFKGASLQRRFGPPGATAIFASPAFASDATNFYGDSCWNL